LAGNATHFQEKTEEALSKSAHDAVSWPRFQEQTSSLTGGLDPRARWHGSGAVREFFVCVYLLPSPLRGAGTRHPLGSGLSPASPQEILAASLSLPGVCRQPGRGPGRDLPAGRVLQPSSGDAHGFGFWLSGVGLTISSLARTQRTASMTALCYMLVVAFTLFICQPEHVPFSLTSPSSTMRRGDQCRAVQYTRVVSLLELLAMVILAYAWV